MTTAALQLPAADQECLRIRDDIGRLTSILLRSGPAADADMPRIVVAIDGTAIGLDLVEQLLKWRRQGWHFDVHLVIVHDYLGKEAAERLLEEVCLKDSAEVRAALTAAEMAHTLHVLMGNPAPAILERADALDATMILMGTRGHGPIGSVLLGSVAYKVVHGASRPVTLVRA